MLTSVVLVAMAAWLALLVLPARSWLNGEVLDELSDAPIAAGQLTVLIPARDEASVIGDTVLAVRSQAPDVHIIVVDDHSTDGTANVVRNTDARVQVVQPEPKPDDWSGKLWALEHGLAHVSTPLVLLLDADIVVQRGFLPAMVAAKRQTNVSLLSIMARLRMQSFWEKLLVPAFVFFFKQVYPFRLSNSRSFRIAAAAGGCVLVETNVLREVGAFASIKDRIIDDCALARQVKDRGYNIWIGLSHHVVSRREYNTLESIWTMVERTAYAQLGHSPLLLLTCTIIMLICYWAPVAGLSAPMSMPYSLVALAAMMISYTPTLTFYRRSPVWAFLLPLIAMLYLLMTWSSALKHRYAAGVEWKGRRYG